MCISWIGCRYAGVKFKRSAGFDGVVAPFKYKTTPPLRGTSQRSIHDYSQEKILNFDILKTLSMANEMKPYFKGF